MTTAKPKYAGQFVRGQLGEFSDQLREKLKKFFPESAVQDNQICQNTADTFIASILAEASWAIPELHWRGLECTKAELKAERDDLLKRVKELELRLRGISPDLNVLLGVDADPLGCADRLSKLAVQIGGVDARVKQLPRFKNQTQKKHLIAVELGVRVLRVLKNYGIPPSATKDIDCGYTSNAVQILKLIGEDIGLCLTEVSWRDKILESKRKAPDLK